MSHISHTPADPREPVLWLLDWLQTYLYISKYINIILFIIIILYEIVGKLADVSPEG